MLEKLVESIVRNRVAVLLVFALVMAAGAYRLASLPVDAFPDTTPVQVQINTTAPALGPEEIEQQITLQVELSIGGLPGLMHVRSISKFGLSQVVATFDDSIDINDAHQFVSERVSTVDLPAGIDSPQLGPKSTGLGEILHYVVRSENPARTIEQLRTIHDWVIKPELRKVPGVAEVNSWGGEERQYHVIVRPDALIKYGLTLHNVFDALELNNHNVGGGQLVSRGKSMLVHGVGRVSSIPEIENIVITAMHGTPVYIRDVADVEIGHEIRRGAVTAQGRGEVVLGLAFMLMGENSKIVTSELKEKLANVQKYLPEDVIVEIVYDRTELVAHVIDTVRHNLTGGAILVLIVLFVLLGRVRAGILVALTIPLAMLFAVIGMYEFGIAASLLSLGAIDFGMLVDGSVVMTESNMRAIATRQQSLGRKLTTPERQREIVKSARVVLRSVIFGMGIIVVVLIPVLGLQGVEGKMFRPMAATFIFALIGALLIAVFLSPVLSYYLLPSKYKDRESIVIRAIQSAYGALLQAAIKLRIVLLPLVLAAIIGAGVLASRLGGEFVPKLSEGALAINVIRLAGTAIEESVSYNTRIESLILEEFSDEVQHVWSRIGTAEVATDPMGIELTDIYLTLFPRDQWTKATTQEELRAAVEASLSDLPGLNMVFTQPIEMRMNELISGVRSDIAIKVYGDDFDELVRVSDDIQRVLGQIEGSADLSADQITGQPTLRIAVDQEELARQGIPARHVLDFVETIGTRKVGEIFENQRQFPLVVRLPDEYRRRIDMLEKALVPAEDGPVVPLSRLATVTETEGPATINREWGRRLIRVQCNVTGRDVASFVSEARAAVEGTVELPEGYVVEWGGTFENLQRAKLRLSVLVPLTLGTVFFLLYFSMKSWRDVLLIYTGIPFAVVGGVVALWYRDMPLSVSAAIGFIALCGIPILNGQLLIVSIRNLRSEFPTTRQAITTAARQRVQPVLATAITDAAGFIPMALSTGVGAEVQRPLATVVIGGVITSTVLTLFVMPLIYELIAERNPDNASAESGRAGSESLGEPTVAPA